MDTNLLTYTDITFLNSKLKIGVWNNDPWYAKQKDIRTQRKRKEKKKRKSMTGDVF